MAIVCNLEVVAISAPKRKSTPTVSWGDPPKTLEDHPFYGLSISDAEQAAYRDALWDKNVKVVIVDAPSGSGKTTLAVAVACMYVGYKFCDEAFYIRTPSSEGRVGFLPGDLPSKEKPYMQPLFSSLISLGENPYSIVKEDSLSCQKNDVGFFSTMTDVYMLGNDYKNKFVIIDEAQCMKTDQLRAIVTRCHDSCKIVVIGSTLQIQGIRPEESGFKHFIEHFSQKPWTKVCKLTKNYRGEISAWADML